MAPANARLKVVREQISETVAHVQALKSQVEQAESKLRDLREKEAAILEMSEDHRRVLSVVRNLPEDVFREIFIACIEADMPTLSYLVTPLPYILAQISSGLRRIALATPAIWTSMDAQINPYHHEHEITNPQFYSILARKAREWFDQAGGLALTVFMGDPIPPYYQDRAEYGPSGIFFDTLFSYSVLWKELRFTSTCDIASANMIRIAALTAVDVPLLQSVSLCLPRLLHQSQYSIFSNTVLLKTPTLKHVSLDVVHIRNFSANWGILTSIALRGKFRGSYSKNELAKIFQQTKCLVSCDIVVGSNNSEEEHYLGKITLPFLKTLHINEMTFGSASSEAPSLLDVITAPALEILRIKGIFLELSLLDLFENSPRIQNLSLPYLKNDTAFIMTIKLLRHCPSLSVLSLYQCDCDWGIQPSNWDANLLLQAFVEKDAVTCPQLQYIKFTGVLDFSLQTLQHFLEGRDGKIVSPDMLPWKRVIIDISAIEDTEIRRQMLNFILKKKAEGLDVDAFSEVKYHSKDARF